MQHKVTFFVSSRARNNMCYITAERPMNGLILALSAVVPIVSDNLKSCVLSYFLHYTINTVFLKSLWYSETICILYTVIVLIQYYKNISPICTI